MTTHRFGVRQGFAFRFAFRGFAVFGFAFLAAALAAPCAIAQQSDTPQKPGKPIRTGEVLSGELSALRVRDVKNRGKRIATYQITSEPRRLPAPNGLCNLETGPETFQLVASSVSQAAQLKSFVGKEIAVKVDEVACAQDVGQVSEAIVTKWSVVAK